MNDQKELFGNKEITNYSPSSYIGKQIQKSKVERKKDHERYTFEYFKKYISKGSGYYFFDIRDWCVWTDMASKAEIAMRINEEKFSGTNDGHGEFVLRFLLDNKSVSKQELIDFLISARDECMKKLKKNYFNELSNKTKEGKSWYLGIQGCENFYESFKSYLLFRKALGESEVKINVFLSEEEQNECISKI